MRERLSFEKAYARGARISWGATATGFALVRLLVVLAIIGILVTRLLSVYHERRTQCRGSLTHVGLALQNIQNAW